MCSVVSVTSCSKKPFRADVDFLLFWMPVALPFVFGGCSETWTAVSIHGNVSYQDKALDNGSIMFYPAAGRPAFAVLNADGDYSIDLEPGEYTVTIENSAPLPPGFKEGDPMPPPKVVLPPEYSTRARSMLKATVAADQSEAIDFKLD
jgi:hypothetical protein